MQASRTVLAALLPLASPSFAQITSPAGFLTWEGTSYGELIGTMSEGRVMHLDGERRGKTTIVREIAYRHDELRYTVHDGMGRSWSSVSIDYAPCDAWNISLVFTRNVLSSPTRVFARSVTWATMAGTPPTRPAQWGLRFPFIRPIVANGQDDLSFDYVFRGGTLANSAPWSSSIAYRLDGHAQEYAAYAPARSHGVGRSNGGCLARSTTLGGDARIFSATYSRHHPNAAWRSQIEVILNSHFTARNETVVQVLGLGGLVAGASFPGVTCNKLYIDFSRPVALFLRRANNAGQATTTLGLVPFDRRLLGIGLWLQAAWTDSGTSAVKLTTASESTILDIPYSALRPTLTARQPGATQALYSSAWSFPIVRYR